jgi:two-component system sensor histidine kinase/response regulator
VSSPSPARILIVDDESDLVTALCRILEAQGFVTTGAASGDEALVLLRAANDEAAPYDVLITDLMMPSMSGLSLLREAHAIHTDMVSIVMTGHGTIDTAVEALKSGALDYMLKPFNLSVAMPVLTRALGVKALRRENSRLARELAHRAAELGQSNAELQAANKELDAYNSSVSHDIRGHLNRIIGFSQLLIDGKTGPLNVKQSEFIGYVYGGADQILRLTDDLLRFSRLSQQPLLKEPVAVGNLVRQVLQEQRQGTPACSVDVQIGALPDAFADPPLLKQVFVNLISNAMKFSGLVAAPFVKVDGYVTAFGSNYRVRDNGAGFDMVHADRLFKVFSRLHSTSEFNGTGIGLSIVQRIVERHGGRISVDAAVGEGAEFTFTLPCQPSLSAAI